MITGDLSAALTAAAGAAVATGELPGPRLPDPHLPDPHLPARDHRAANPPDLGLPSPLGTWRPVPAEDGGGPGCYATTLPFLLAARTGADPAWAAEVLAARLRPHHHVSRVAVTGGGYLSLAVTGAALGQLAVRVSQAGPGCARSEALRGVHLSAPRDARLAAARTWAEAQQRLTAELTGRLAAAAGAQVSWAAVTDAAHGARTSAAAPGGSPAAAIALAGEDAVRLALTRATDPARPAAAILGRLAGQRAVAAQHLGNPAYAGRYAHAHAASALRQAADLGFRRGEAERFQPRLLAHPTERALLDALSWLPERVAGAARRRQPHVVTVYLEDLAGTYFDWQESCSLAQPGAFPPGPAGGEPDPVRQARLWLADAARTAFGAGLGLLGVAPLPATPAWCEPRSPQPA